MAVIQQIRAKQNVEVVEVMKFNGLIAKFKAEIPEEDGKKVLNITLFDGSGIAPGLKTFTISAIRVRSKVTTPQRSNFPTQNFICSDPEQLRETVEKIINLHLNRESRFKEITKAIRRSIQTR